MKSLRRVFLFLVVVALLAVGAPQSAPQFGGPPPVAAAGWYYRTATWWMDSSTDAQQNGGGVYRVKVSLSWQTQDPYGVCYTPGSATPDGVQQYAFTNAPKCTTTGFPFYRPISHFYQSTGFTINCWVSNAFLLTVGIDDCGYLSNAQDSPPYFFVYGTHFHVCVGIYGTPLAYCDYFTSKATILGSSFHIWNSTS